MKISTKLQSKVDNLNKVRQEHEARMEDLRRRAIEKIKNDLQKHYPDILELEPEISPGVVKMWMLDFKVEYDSEANVLGGYPTERIYLCKDGRYHEQEEIMDILAEFLADDL